MILYTDVVTYRWTEVDTLATYTPLVPGLHVTPYRTPPETLEGASDYTEGDYVPIPLSLSIDVPTLVKLYGYTSQRLGKAYGVASRPDSIAAVGTE